MLTPLFKDQKHRKVVVLLSAFGDDSADDKEQRVFCVAAVVGSEEQWDAIEDKWRARLGCRIFHAADCESDKKAFKYFSHDDNLTLYRRLTQVVADSGLLCYAHVLDMEAFRKVFHDGMPPRTSQYFFCFTRVVTDCVRAGYLSLPQHPVKFTFDMRTDTKWNTAALYRYATTIEDWKFADYLADEIAFAARANIGIQVADLVAREAMKEADRFIHQGRDIRDSYRALAASGRLRVRVYPESFIQQMREAVAQLGFPHSQADYLAWKQKRRIKNDDVSRRLEFLIYADAKAGLTKGANEYKD